MRNIIYKIKSKIVNIDVRLRHRLILSICACLFSITAIIQIVNVNAAGHKLTRQLDATYSGHGSKGHVSEDYPSTKFSLDGNVGKVFCVDPNRATLDSSSPNEYLSTKTPPDHLYYNVQKIASTNSCPNVAGCGPLGKTKLSDKDAEFISKLAAYNLYINTSDTARAAVQTLIWEVSTGSRTSTTGDDKTGEDAYAPTYTDSTKSWYGKYVKGKNTTFASNYKSAIRYAKNYSSSAPSTARGSIHKMTYDINKQKWTITINGNYKRWTCNSSTNIKIDNKTDEKLELSSSNFISEGSMETITCTRDDDGNSNIGKKGIWYYKKGWGPDDLGPNDNGQMVSKRYNYQMLVKGGTEKLTTNLKAYTDGYPVKVFKKNEKNEDLSGAEFTFTKVDDSSKKYVVNGSGTPVIIVPGVYTVEETKVPNGYSKANTITMTINGSNNNESNVSFENNTYTLIVNDAPLIINWYKTNETGIRLPGAKFNIDNGLVKWNLKDASGCYISDPNGVNTEFESDANGEVCVTRISSGTHIITEIQSAQYHTFGSNRSITITDSTSKQPISNLNTLINYSTVFEFSKSVSDNETDPEIINLNTSLLQRLKFNIKVDNGNGTYGSSLLFEKISDGEYKFIDNQTNLTTAMGPITSDLQLNSNRKIIIKYLPWTINYIIEEKNEDGCTDEARDPSCSVTIGNSCNGSGYYFDTGVAFRITQASSNNASSLVTGYGNTTASLVNVPVEINLNKDDIYQYYNSFDKSEINKDENIIDTARFVLRDANGNILKLKKISDGNYRYLPITEDGNYNNIVTEINTKNGSLKITHLCRGQVYYIEEVRTTNPSSFILPTNVKEPVDKPDAWIWEGHPYVKYITPNTLSEANNNKQSITQTISNIPSRVVFEKRDLKYGYLISDESTTFKVYRCDSNTDKCHAEIGEIVNFEKRALIQSDNSYDYDVVNSIEVYKYSKLNSENVQELHPYKGVLALRYLPAGYYDKENVYHKYKYVLVEVQAPDGYDTPVGEDAEIQFEVSDSTIDIEATKVPNKPSKLIIKKYDSYGNLLTGAKFRIYKVNKNDYDENLSAMNQKKTLLTLKTIRDGIYEHRKDYDTSEFTMCIDKDLEKCSAVTQPLIDYSLDEKIEVKQGEALIQYLEVENYYVIEEVQAPDGYELPKNKEDRFKLIYLKNSTESIDEFTELINTETTFQFYKFDEYNNPLDGSEFKLQRLNKDKKYEDITITKTLIEKNTVYKLDPSSKNTIITTENGTAIIAYIPKGQYRIFEVKAAPGKELPKKTLNVATFFVDESGNVYGNSIITNKSKTQIIEIKPEAKAEVIVNIQTGQVVIRYTIIIIILVIVTIGLFIIKKKLEKK